MVSKLRHGVCYSPTWTTYKPPYGNNGPQAQFSDGDFANISFQALWNFGGNLRDDLGTLGGARFNLVRLYNWGPTRGWNGTRGDAHMPFLDFAAKQGLQVIVPISNYFLSSAEYAWGKDAVGNGRVPDAAYSFGSAPAGHPGGAHELHQQRDPSQHVQAASRRSLLHGRQRDRLEHSGGPGRRRGRANGAFGSHPVVDRQPPGSPRCARRPDSTILTTWFQAFVDGVKKGQPYPNGTNPGGPTKAFTGAWKGLEVFAWYTSWYYNCANIYQDGQTLTDTIGQYDAWKPGSDNHRNWPGQQFTVPLLLGEVGWRREGNNEGQQFDKVVNGIVTPLEKYAQSRPTTRLAGYCVYSFNDEAYISANWGMFKTAPGTPPEMPTGVTRVSYATWPSVNLPVEKLLPVMSSDRVGLIDALKKIFTS